MNLRLLGVLLILTGCYFQAPVQQEGKFTLIPPGWSGVRFQNQLEDTEIFNILNYLYYYNGGGVAIGDVNNDSLPDLFFTANLLSNKLYLNQGNFQFEDISLKAGVGGMSGWSTGVCMVDINQDGWLDIYVSNIGDYLDKSGHNELFVNQQDGTFLEQAKDYGLDLVGFSTQATFFDFDRDGDLDMFQLNHSIRPSETVGDIRQRLRRDSLAGDRMMRNDGGYFVDVTDSAGIYSSRLGYGLSVLTGDINLDGWPDLYICNDFHEDDYLYFNQGDGTFLESLQAAIGHSSKFSMGSDLADINQDGWPDLISLDMKPYREEIIKSAEPPESYEIFELKRSFGYYHQYPHNALQLHQGIHPDKGPQFSEISQILGIDATDWSWSALFADFSHNGLPDLYITNGIYHRPNDMDYIKFISKPEIAIKLNGEPSKEELAFIRQMPSVILPNQLFAQKSLLKFEDKKESWGLDQAAFSNGAAYADLDLDGDLDLVVNNINAPAFIYRNDLADGHFLRIQLAGKVPNRQAIGAKVYVYTPSAVHYREQFPVRGFQSSMEPILHIGLGESKQIDSLVVHWPDQSKSNISSPEADQLITIEQKESGSVKDILTAENAFLLEAINPNQLGLRYHHRENKHRSLGGYHDFQREALIPHTLSTEGPALAIGDVNGDGWEDLYLGGAQRQAGVLFVQNGRGGFIEQQSDFWMAEAMYEDINAAFFDADGDRDLDLLVVSGGNEFFEGDPVNQDRLYLNDGKGTFRRAGPNALPPLRNNAACIAPADWDQDGDIDVFIGNRAVPGQYGKRPVMHFLENNGQGQFRELAMSDPMGAMLTDAHWMDYDQDGDEDLWLVGEWMPVTLMQNQGKGKFTHHILPELAQSHGWWNALYPTDFDGDGDMDWFLGNLGKNSTMKASASEPCHLYLSDFDQNGSLDPIICDFNEGQSYPIASLDEILKQLIPLRQRYLHYRDYAGATVEDLFGQEALQKAEIYPVYTFASAFVENLGNGSYEIQELKDPWQYAPIYDFLSLDINSDQKKDILAVGNFYGVGPNRGRYDAGYGWLGINQGDTSIQWSLPRESGFWVEGECRAIGSLRLASGSDLIIVVRNNQNLQLFSQSIQPS